MPARGASPRPATARTPYLVRPAGAGAGALAAAAGSRSPATLAAAGSAHGRRCEDPAPGGTGAILCAAS